MGNTYEPPTNAPVKTLKKNDMLSQSLRECMKRRRERERGSLSFAQVRISSFQFEAPLSPSTSLLLNNTTNLTL